MGEAALDQTEAKLLLAEAEGLDADAAGAGAEAAAAAAPQGAELSELSQEVEEVAQGVVKELPQLPAAEGSLEVAGEAGKSRCSPDFHGFWHGFGMIQVPPKQSMAAPSRD